MNSIFPGIVVDQFSFRLQTETAFLLTHWHKDHLKGLTYKWNKGIIYCSEITRDILLRARPYINSSQVIGMIPYKSYFIHGVEVIMMDSHHMIGGAMFYFKRDQQTVLYTGDYRYSPSMILPSYADSIFLDGLYHDSPVRLLTNDQSCTLVHSWIQHNDEDTNHPLYIGYFHFGTCELLHGLHTNYNYTFQLQQKFMTEEDFNVCLMMYPEMWNQNSNLIVTPVHSRNKEPLPLPIMLASAGWSMLKENQQYMGEVAVDHLGHYRINFSNHSDMYENQALLSRVKHSQVFYTD